MTIETPSVPASWTEEEKAAVAAMKGGLANPNIKTIQDIRDSFAGAPVFPTPAGLKITPVKIPRVPVPGLEEHPTGEVDAEWIEPEGNKDAPVLIYVHGGGYCIMSPVSHRPITCGISAHGVRVLSVDYRMAPEHPYPAAIVDTVAALAHVLGHGVPASKICLSGDSAGGGLTLATALYLRDQDKYPQFAALLPISPWIDLTGSSPTTVLGEEFDACIIARGRNAIAMMANSYSPNPAELTKPLVSPLYAEVDPHKPLPPTHALLATCDRLFGEDLSWSVRSISAGQSIQVDVYEDQFHVFELLPFLTQSHVAYARMADFVKSSASGHKHGTSYHLIKPDGKVLPVHDGLRDLQRRLKGYLDRAKAQGLDGDVEAKRMARYEGMTEASVVAHHAH